jgi:hypothetical protein
MEALRYWVREALRVSAYTTTEHQVGHRRVALGFLNHAASNPHKAAAAGDALVHALRLASEGFPLQALREAEIAIGLVQ